MPVAGRKAKPAGQAVNRHKPTHDWTEVLNVPFEGGQDLPDFRADGRRWPDRTKQKWNAWRAMPHCKLWGPAEWDFALDSIELAALVHEGRRGMPPSSETGRRCLEQLSTTYATYGSGTSRRQLR